MIRPVGPKGGSGEFPVTKIPPGAAEVSDVAQARLARVTKPGVGKTPDFKKRNVQMSPEDPTTEKTEDTGFDFFDEINRANAKP